MANQRLVGIGINESYSRKSLGDKGKESLFLEIEGETVLSQMLYGYRNR